jgi:hypothetical protein
VSVGGRQTRRRRRARRRRARLRELASIIAGAPHWRVVRNLIYSVFILVSLGGAIISVFTGEYGLVILFCLLALFLFATLWILEVL